MNGQENKKSGLVRIGNVIKELDFSGLRSSSPEPTPPFSKRLEKELVECQSCHQTFNAEITYYRVLGRERIVKPRECVPCRAEREAEEAREALEALTLQKIKLRKDWKSSCGISGWMMEKTFDNFDRRYQREAYGIALDYVQEFTTEQAIGYPSLVFYSEANGLGKTHLAVAIANHVIESWDGDPARASCPVRFESGPGLIRRIRATYNIRDGDSWHEREEDVYSKLRGVRLLILDDVGKEKPSEHTREVYFYVIDERYKSGLPVIVTSNLPLEGQPSLCDLMGASTVDRLTGMTRGKIIELRGRSFRQLKRQP